MTLALHSSAQSQSGSSTSNSVRYTTTVANCIVVAIIQTTSSSAFSTATISDANGLTWTRRSRSQNQLNAPVTQFYNTDVYWAKATATQANVLVSVALSSAAPSNLTIFTVSGVQNFTSPFDSNASLPKVGTYSNGSTPQSPTSGFCQTTGTNSFVFSCMSDGQGGVAPNTGSGFTLLYQNAAAGGQLEGCTEYKILTSAASANGTYSGNEYQYQIVADAITGDAAAGATGTISMSLTKASISAAAKVVKTGTITTALSKASQSVTGVYTAVESGTITTALRKASQSLLGAGANNIATITTALTKASFGKTTAFMSIPMAVFSTNDTNGFGATSGPITNSINTTGQTNCVLVAVFQTHSTAARTITGVTGGGLTWTRRSVFNEQHGIDYQNIEVWWAPQAIGSGAISVSATLSGAVQDGSVNLFGVTGATDINSPWDLSPTLPLQKAILGSAAVSAGPYSTLAASTISFGIAQYLSPTGTVGVGNGTQIWATTNTCGEYLKSTSPVSGAAFTFSPNIQADVALVVDAIAGGPPPVPTAIIATALQKLSQTLSGGVGPAGHITTALQKASQAVVGKASITGPITTALSRPSMLASGKTFVPVTGTITAHLQGVPMQAAGTSGNYGPIVTRLGKVTMSLSGRSFLAVTGTATTALKKVAQSANGWTTEFGTVRTDLSRVGISGQALEIETGVIVTNLDATGITIVARAFEIETGTITTNLGPLSQQLQGLEEEIGYIVTRLGGESGQLVATSGQGQEIILGPIVMDLSGLRQVLLGAKLKPPGEGTWYSWRMTDS